MTHVVSLLHAHGTFNIFAYVILRKMVSSIVLPIKKVYSLVDGNISIEMKDDGRKFQGRLVAVDEYLNLHLEESVELLEENTQRELGSLVIRGNNILSIAPLN
jgi:small nuclear ribonucleoprotein (snRNP)-like protein